MEDKSRGKPDDAKDEQNDAKIENKIRQQIRHLEKYSDDVNFWDLRNFNTIAKCVRVYDGDSIWLKIPMPKPWNCVRVNCRIWGIDTSEIRGGQPLNKILGYTARDFLINLIQDQYVNVIFIDSDKYGRQLVHLYSIKNNKFINNMMISEGHSIKYLGSGIRKNELDNQIAQKINNQDPSEMINYYQQNHETLEQPEYGDLYPLYTNTTTFSLN